MEVPHTYPLADFPDGLTLAPKGCAPVWRFRVSGWCQVGLWQLTFGREALLRNNVGLLKLLVGEYRSEQTFKRREREKKKIPRLPAPSRCRSLYFCL